MFYPFSSDENWNPNRIRIRIGTEIESGMGIETGTAWGGVSSETKELLKDCFFLTGIFLFISIFSLGYSPNFPPLNPPDYSIMSSCPSLILKSNATIKTTQITQSKASSVESNQLILYSSTSYKSRISVTALTGKFKGQCGC